MADAQLELPWQLDPESVRALALGINGNPFAALGPHDTRAGRIIRAFLPGASKVEVLRRSDGTVLAPLEPTDESGLFENLVGEAAPYLFRIYWPQAIEETEDPYSFGLFLGEVDLFLFNEGRHFELAKCLGAQSLIVDGVSGVRFAVWAPNAACVAVIGDFNSWDARRHPMRVRHGAGIWELFLPRVAPGSRYKYDIVGAGGSRLPMKADPVARRTETPPNTASVVAQPDDHRWHDENWMQSRARRHAPEAPISIFEVHIGSWLKPSPNYEATLWDFAVERLVPYLVEMGFTHVELLPITEHPFGGVLGLSAAEPVRAERAVRDPARAIAFRGRTSLGRHRHHSRLGAGAFPHRSAWSRALRWNRPLRAAFSTWEKSRSIAQAAPSMGIARTAPRGRD